MKLFCWRVPNFLVLPRTRQVLTITVLGTFCVLILGYAPQLQTWREQWKQKWSVPPRMPPVTSITDLREWLQSSTQTPTKTVLTAQRLREVAQTLRTEHSLPLLQDNVTLQRLARLLTLEVEDTQSLSVPADTSEILSRLTPVPPKNIEIIVFFAPYSLPDLDLTTQLASSAALLSKSTTQVGIATRSGTLDRSPGVFGVVALARTFPSEPPTLQPANRNSARQPSFTGQDLWLAVQNYRKAHELPAFEQANELCTVASIRVNELLELGKLDNHDGFQKRAGEFFDRNPGWTAINENIAAGYETAVQTVEWGWDQSLGHQALIQSREYPKACAAANRGFSVLITGK